jgi:hypothetical protein
MLDKILLPEDYVVGKIYLVNNKKVMLDIDISELYEIPTKRINEQVKRNRERFRSDFIFQLTKKQWEGLRSNFANANHEKRRFMPHAFKEHQVLMLSSVLKSERATQLNIQVVRIFTKLRDTLLVKSDITEHLEKLKKRIDYNDEKMDGMISYLQRIFKENGEGRSKIGFQKLQN